MIKRYSDKYNENSCKPSKHFVKTYLMMVTSCTDPATKIFVNNCHLSLIVDRFPSWSFFLVPTNNHNTKTRLGKNINPIMPYPQEGWPFSIWSWDAAPSPRNGKWGLLIAIKRTSISIFCLQSSLILSFYLL